MDQAKGEFFKWTSADDLYGRDLLLRCVEALDTHPDVVLAHAWNAVIDNDGQLTQSMEYPLTTDALHAPARFRSFLFGCSGLFPGPDGKLVRYNNDGILRASDEYGVVRSSVLKQTSLLGSFPSSDRVLVCELLLRARSTRPRSGSISGATTTVGPTDRPPGGSCPPHRIRPSQAGSAIPPFESSAITSSATRERSGGLRSQPRSGANVTVPLVSGWPTAR